MDTDRIGGPDEWGGHDEIHEGDSIEIDGATVEILRIRERLNGSVVVQTGGS